MKITLKRRFKAESYTIGALYVDGVYLCDTLEDRDRGLKHDMPIEDIIMQKVKAETAIPTGTYKVVTDIVSPKYSTREAYRFCGGKVPRLLNVPGYEGILIHCLHPDMEILTVGGWKNMYDYNNEDLYTINTLAGETEIKPNLQTIKQKYSGDMFFMENISADKKKRFYITAEHELYHSQKEWNGNDKWMFSKVKDMPFNFKILGSAYPVNGIIPDDDTLNKLKLAFFAMADGSFSRRGSKAFGVTLQFHFKKERKIHKVVELIENCRFTYRICKGRDDDMYITLHSEGSDIIANILGVNKEGNYKSLSFDILKYDASVLRELIEVYAFGDGKFTHTDKCPNQIEISTVDLNTLNVIQAMSSISGWNCRYYKSQEAGIRKCFGSEYNCKAFYEIIIDKEQEIVSHKSVQSINKEFYEGDVWCVQNENRTIITRYNGFVTVMSNCGNYARDTEGCILVGENKVKGQVINSTATFKRLYGLLEDADDITIEIA
jgi:hypothetical protein